MSTGGWNLTRHFQEKKEETGEWRSGRKRHGDLDGRRARVLWPKKNALSLPPGQQIEWREGVVRSKVSSHKGHRLVFADGAEVDLPGPEDYEVWCPKQ